MNSIRINFILDDQHEVHPATITFVEEDIARFQSVFTFGRDINQIFDRIHKGNSVNTMHSCFVFDLLQSSIEINNGIRTQMHFSNIVICIRISEFDTIQFCGFFRFPYGIDRTSKNFTRNISALGNQNEMFQIGTIVVDVEEGPSFQSIFTFGVNIKNISNGIHKGNSFNTAHSRFVFDLIQSSIEINDGIFIQMHFANTEICIRTNEVDIVRFGRFFQNYRFDLNTDFINIKIKQFEIRLRIDQYKYRILIIFFIGNEKDIASVGIILIIRLDVMLIIHNSNQIDLTDDIITSSVYNALQSFISIKSIYLADMFVLIGIKRTIGKIAEIYKICIFIRIIVVLIVECKRIIIRFICRRFGTKLTENFSVHGYDGRRCTISIGVFHVASCTIHRIHHFLDSIMRIFIGAGTIPRIIREITTINCIQTDHRNQSFCNACDRCLDLFLLLLGSHCEEIRIVDVICDGTHSLILSNEIIMFDFMSLFRPIKFLHFEIFLFHVSTSNVL